MQNKVVAVYRNDEVAHAAVNELLEDGFTLDQIYISSEDAAGQVEKYDLIGESNLLVDLKGDLGDFYRSIVGVDVYKRQVPRLHGRMVRPVPMGGSDVSFHFQPAVRRTDMQVRSHCIRHLKKDNGFASGS